MGVVWVLVRNPTGEYEQAELVFAQTMEGAWTLTPFISVSEWDEEAFERPDDEWEDWGPVIDLSESSGHSVERSDELSSHDHPQTQAWGFLAVTGIAARPIRSVRLRSSSGRETTVDVDGDSGAFLAVMETLDEDGVLAVMGTTDSGETVNLD